MAVKSLSPGPALCLQVLAQSCFRAWQDLAGQTLTRPFQARPRKCHLAGVNDYHSNGRVTCSQQEPRSLHLSASHFPCPPFISLQVNYSSCPTERDKSTAQTLKKLHTQFTDIITRNEKINVPAWAAKANSSQMHTQNTMTILFDMAIDGERAVMILHRQKIAPTMTEWEISELIDFWHM